MSINFFSNLDFQGANQFLQLWAPGLMTCTPECTAQLIMEWGMSLLV